MKKAQIAVRPKAPVIRYPDKTEALSHFLFESLTEFAVFAVSPTGVVISWNAGAQRTFGYTEDEIIGRHFSLIFTPDDILANAPDSELATALSGGPTDHDRWHVRKDGTRFWGTNTVQPIFDSAGVLLGFAKLVRDITEKHIALEALSDSEQRVRLLIESVQEYAIFAIGLDGTITSWNIGAQSTFGYAESEIIGRQLSVLYTADDMRADVPGWALREATLRGHFADERWLVRKDKTRFLSTSKISQLKRGTDGELRGFVMIAHDITERKRLADDLRRRALNDQLTQLPNRTAFYEHVHRAIASMKRRRSNMFAVLFIDLDHFKTINDTYGHIVADRLLEFIARRLEQCVRTGDIVARLGGDEFAILVNGIDGVTDATDAGDRIGTQMAKPISIDGYDMHITASVGIALGGSNYEKPDDILRDADAAMYAAKTRGRARAILFEPSMKVDGGHDFDLEADLRGAVGRGEMRVEYQPIVELQTRATVGFEALVRWQHPRRGRLQPHDFIARAEATEAIIALDRWVFAVACKQLRIWQDQRDKAGSLRMSVNFSSKQFSHPELIDALTKILTDTGVDPRSMRLEITESGIVERSDRTAALLARIRLAGIPLHLDDFGMGYSSLAALAQTPVDALKIDRSFVAGMSAPGGSELVASIVSLAHNLGLIAIAEGVETIEQLSRLERFGCDFAQGTLFSKPLEATAAGEFLGIAGYALK